MPDYDAPQISTGPPAGTKETSQRVDFDTDKFEQQIYQHGYRLWWSRASLCPCEGNSQTAQVDPTCQLCRGSGWLYFLPDPLLEHEGEDASGNEVELNEAKDAVSIQAIITSTTGDPKVFEKFGEWIFGTAKITTSRDNRIGYRDRLVARDSAITYSQLFKASGNSTVIVSGLRSVNGLWSPLSKVHMLRSVDTVFREGDDFEVTSTGRLLWLGTAPSDGTVISVCGEFIPSLIVMDHVYAIRDTMVSHKTKAKGLAAQYERLPVHAMGKLDFLADD